jgi:hypothetical protein
MARRPHVSYSAISQYQRCPHGVVLPGVAEIGQEQLVHRDASVLGSRVRSTYSPSTRSYSAWLSGEPCGPR